ncbi:MAG: phosphomannose isomerase type II C-terminal cupin domain [Candidatus Aminicenantes bacterium]|jgi:mannose-6-phosphate isomerase-like protein (cupin superfamily)|nr:phosphomannose isomerase type II C-terminal cupin domain [Candidatus Aminicenantes bacterium]
MTKSPSDDEKNFRARIIEDIRPWGKFRAYPHKNTGSIKIITVKPGASLSLQFHHRRSEFWIALDRGLEITVGKKVWRPKKGEEIYVPRKTAHRLRCVGRSPARVMEIWLGHSDESDIVRLEDKYGRS